MLRSSRLLLKESIIIWGNKMEDRLINVCADAITLLHVLGHAYLANILQERVNAIMGVHG